MDFSNMFATPGTFKLLLRNKTEKDNDCELGMEESRQRQIINTRHWMERIK